MKNLHILSSIRRHEQLKGRKTCKLTKQHCGFQTGAVTREFSPIAKLAFSEGVLRVTIITNLARKNEAGSAANCSVLVPFASLSGAQKHPMVMTPTIKTIATP